MYIIVTVLFPKKSHGFRDLFKRLLHIHLTLVQNATRRLDRDSCEVLQSFSSNRHEWRNLHSARLHLVRSLHDRSRLHQIAEMESRDVFHCLFRRRDGFSVGVPHRRVLITRHHKRLEMLRVREHVGEIELHLVSVGRDGLDGPVENGIVVGNGLFHDVATTLKERGHSYYSGIEDS